MSNQQGNVFSFDSRMNKIQGKGKIILLESGTDGAGKAEQSKRLEDALLANNILVRKVDFPRYDNVSSVLVRKYLQGDFGNNADEVNPYTASTFYAVDRFASYLEDWRDFYLSGGYIILDRYSTSNMIYQGAKMKTEEEILSFANWLIDLEHIKGGLPVPTHTLYLDVPPVISQKLREGRPLKNTGNKDIHEEDISFMERSYQTGLILCEALNWERIQCFENNNLLSIEAIHQRILDTLKIV